MKDRIELALDHMMTEIENGPFVSAIQVAALASSSFWEAYRHLPPGAWEDKKDEFSEAIEAAFPTRSGNHERYAKALQMVSNRYGKYELVNLVNWLLQEIHEAKQGTKT